MRTARSAWVAGTVLMYPMMLLSGAFFTVDIMPAIVKKVSAFMPLTYVVNLLRGLWMGQPWGDLLLEVGVLAGMLLVGIVVSVKTFRWE
jgi:ABC-2 type transport system permease protein